MHITELSTNMDLWHKEALAIGITSLENYKCPDKMLSLDLGNNKIKNLATFNVNNLKELRLNGNPIESISNLNVKNIEEISFSECEIKSLKDFNPKELKIIYSWSNKIEEVESLDFKKIEESDFSNNLIKFIINFKVIYANFRSNKINFIWGYEGNGDFHNNPLDFVHPTYLNSDYRKGFDQDFSPSTGWRLDITEEEKASTRAFMLSKGCNPDALERCEPIPSPEDSINSTTAEPTIEEPPKESFFKRIFNK